MSSAEVHDEATARSTVYRLKDQSHACSSPALENPTNSTTHHSSSLYSSSSHEDFEPVQKKSQLYNEPELDNDPELYGDCIHPSLSGIFALERKKPQVDIDTKLDKGMQ